MNNRRLCYKSVRKDGSSLFAPPGIGRVYEIGKTYRFPSYRPAFVFEAMDRSLTVIYTYRSEPFTSSRVLICIAHGLRRGNVAIVKFWEPSLALTYRWTAFTTKLTVIGEICVPASWQRERPKIKCAPNLWHYEALMKSAN